MTFNRIAFIFGLVLVLIVSIVAIQTKPVNTSNTTLITAVYRGISKSVYRGTVSYNLYLEGTSGYYKIAADNSACFAYTAFKNNVAQGQTISVYVNHHTLISKPFIVSIVANGQEYLSFGCVNQGIAANKIKIPLFSIGAFVLLVVIVYVKTNKRSKNPPTFS